MKAHNQEKPLESGNTEKISARSGEERKRRFRLIRLEERIAPGTVAGTCAPSDPLSCIPKRHTVGYRP
jgi:hypothetical protein